MSSEKILRECSFISNWSKIEQFNLLIFKEKFNFENSFQTIAGIFCKLIFPGINQIGLLALHNDEELVRRYENIIDSPFWDQ